MCKTCGCAVPTPDALAPPNAPTPVDAPESKPQEVQVIQKLLEANDREAAHNREHFDRHQVLTINLMSSPGAGKTTLLERTSELLGPGVRFAVVVGDLETDRDAERIRRTGRPAVQITTGHACHLDARMVHKALHQLDLSEIDILFIENVGNLVCPASFDLGHHFNVALLSCTEGEDKPSKYPVMFRAADLVLFTKADLIDILGDFDPESATERIRELAQPCPVFNISARKDSGLKPWLEWLEARRAEFHPA